MGTVEPEEFCSRERENGYSAAIEAITSQHVPQHVTQHVIEQAEQKTDTKSKDTTSKKPLPGCTIQGFLVAVAI
ncbi:unnamed protein product [Symbiodinium pilosum]|uniref:Uncharacterized protein n=1 Tax=Symbiodinium pilosum TaxID=2952 RepID=A0A812TS60_SYMPI|nr:unnamed protein product [Symbiodinium pilosum]